MSRRRPQQRPPRGRPTRRIREGDGPERVPSLIHKVGAALRSKEPLDLLLLASGILVASDSRFRSGGAVRGPDPEELLESFLGHDSIETTALLRAIATLGWPFRDGDRIAAELARRTHTLPLWLEGLDPMTVREVMTLGHVLGDGEDYLLGVRTGAGDDFTILIYVDHNMGTVVKDAFALPTTIEAVAARARRDLANDPDTTLAVCDRADAAARLHQAIEIGDRFFPPLETPTWPICRPLVEWALGRMPRGGAGYDDTGISEAESQALIKRFLASAQAADLDEVQRDLVDPLVWFCAGHRSGDPLRWSPVVVEIALLDFFPRKVLVPPAELARVPGLIRAFVRFAHTERGVRPVHTDATVAAVDRLETEFLAMVRERRVRPRHAFDDGRHPADLALEALAAQFGGVEALRALDDRPLPDEPFDWSGIAGDIHDLVGHVLTLADRCCDELLDQEHRTACRRLLARVARTNPAFMRRGREDTTAAAFCWAIGTINGTFMTDAGPRVKDLTAWFAAKTSPSQRGSALLGIAGVFYGDAGWHDEVGRFELFVAGARARLVALRDFLEPRGESG